jgi:hypothetical protein
MSRLEFVFQIFFSIIYHFFKNKLRIIKDMISNKYLMFNIITKDIDKNTKFPSDTTRYGDYI